MKVASIAGATATLHDVVLTEAVGKIVAAGVVSDVAGDDVIARTLDQSAVRCDCALRIEQTHGVSTRGAYDSGMELGCALAMRGVVHPGTLIVGTITMSGAVFSARGTVAALLAACADPDISRAIVGPGAVAGIVLDYCASVGLEVVAVATVADAYAGGCGAPLRAADPAPLVQQPLPPHLEAVVDEILGAVAAGQTRILLRGALGSGMTAVARAVVSRLPALHPTDALAVARVYDAAGLFGQVRRPFRAPHHTASRSAIVGGGWVVRPGELSLAHHGVLFFDEAPEFRREVIDATTRALPAGAVTVRGVAMPATPAVVLGSAHLCPCGHTGDATRVCACSAPILRRWGARVHSLGPLWQHEITMPERRRRR